MCSGPRDGKGNPGHSSTQRSRLDTGGEMATFGALLVIVFTIVAALSCVNAAPCPSSLESDLTILMHNDLYGTSIFVRFDRALLISSLQET